MLSALGAAATCTLRPGDTVWFAPGERHWHGAAADIGMSHIAIQEVAEGRAAGMVSAVIAALAALVAATRLRHIRPTGESASESRSSEESVR